MFREMRRANQTLSQAECFEILNNNTAGVLALSGDEGYPYAVPLSYACFESKIFFHCAKTGHKIDAINNNPKVSFCVIDKDHIMPEKYTTYYRSVIAFGKAKILNDNTEILQALNLLAKKYSPLEKNHNLEIAKGLPNVSIIEFKIEHITGKQARELVKAE